MNTTRFTFSILFAALIYMAGCVTKPAADPLAGWKIDLNDQPDDTIVKDYQDYIRNLPPKLRHNAQGPFWFFKDGSGQHAIKMEIALNGAYYEHLLIYDQNDKRIKVVVYSGGRYAS